MTQAIRGQNRMLEDFLGENFADGSGFGKSPAVTVLVAPGAAAATIVEFAPN